MAKFLFGIGYNRSESDACRFDFPLSQFLHLRGDLQQIECVSFLPEGWSFLCFILGVVVGIVCFFLW
jgi:hypothetical protein